MPIETATNISQLVSTNPAGSDLLSTVDNHVRLIKATLLATFPSITGLATQAEAEAGTIATKVMTPLAVKQAISANETTTTAGTYTKLTVDTRGRITATAAITWADMPANPSLTGTLTLGSSTATGALLIGRTGTANTPYISFRSGATAAPAYDSRIIASGGTGADGAGTLTYNAATHALNGDVTVSSGGSYATTTDNDGTISSGTYRPTPIGGNFINITNGGAFTFAVPTQAGYYTLVVDITNSASAGTITFSGFAKVIGSSYLTTTSGNKFQVFITKTSSGTTANIIPMQ